jgi:hypothetical protein
VPQTVRRNETVSLAARVLSRGAASIAPRGRADDFSWPRPNATTAEELEPRPNIGCPVVPLEEGIKKVMDPQTINRAGPTASASPPSAGAWLLAPPEATARPSGRKYRAM